MRTIARPLNEGVVKSGRPIQSPLRTPLQSTFPRIAAKAYPIATPRKTDGREANPLSATPTIRMDASVTNAMPACWLNRLAAESAQIHAGCHLAGGSGPRDHAPAWCAAGVRFRRVRRLLTAAFAAMLAVACGAQQGSERGSGATGALATATAPAETAPAPTVRIGAEELDSAPGRRLRGLRVGVIANAASVTHDGRPSVWALRAHGARVVRLFSPEHGYRARGPAGARQGDSRAFGIPVVSLYGAKQAPTAHDLRGLDALVYDLQDAGVRFYTYVSTEILALRAAARARLPFVVLDRPNPLGGEVVAGPVRRGPETFAATAPGPLVYGLTSGEMARYVNAHTRPRARLTVIRMRGWRRHMTWPQTGRPWTPPSPGLRTWRAALTYPGMALFEGTSASVGGGTRRSYQMLCAPWLDGRALAARASHLGVPATPITVVPHPLPSAREPKFRDQRCRGALLHPRDDGAVNAYRAGLGLLLDVRREPRFRWLQGGAITDAVLGTPLLRRRVDAGWSLKRILAAEAPAVRAWQARRAPCLLY
jgi:uncharacterized protein YbbC (DUF1343 family)